ncbi:glycosyltransferase [Tanticharoenia sakaeratensis]|uniref:Dolichol-phosphate mannosyltransferase n=1 Tax=Tanticharoenia sakaeratensis NBRC 103193 TaxID=1231623 RepID=A0A0D6MNS3_9PROT|nr:glycosyltransferase family 2 protein [Tanticharoenia sakaeratensis]GAN55101.1 dolichol-phosphate mannosyltransferase [Tanticharoenia sakaeratensis NBRC 103193]GBQ20216.1 dolichol-phosphate mannosyltransferase [Tanticharoenia sakaeratensis NBRC 103193]
MAGEDARAASLPAHLSIVVPCYKEAANVRPLVAALDTALVGLSWEVIFVDDNSPDGTAGVVRDVASVDPRVRVIQRVGRRGLSSAVIEGFLSSSASIVAVLDGDLQHDESALPAMVRLIAHDQADLVVASRHVEGGTNAGLANAWRRWLSNSGIRAAQALLPYPLSDPMSGFFAIRRDLFQSLLPKLSGAGFKILLDLAMSAGRDMRVAEVPAVFRPRLAGESKLDVVVLLQFAMMIVDKLCRGYVPTRFVAFGVVGLIGVAVNLGISTAARIAGFGFSKAQTVGTIAAIFADFWLNNTLTYRDRRLRGVRMWGGLVVFTLACSLGGIANIGVARMAYATFHHWDRSSAVGAVIGVVWNYAIASTLVWR